MKKLNMKYPHSLRQETTASEILSKCRHLTLCGQDEHGELEWIGTTDQYIQAEIDNVNIIHFAEVKKSWRYGYSI
jgi:hypothetical protein